MFWAMATNGKTKVAWASAKSFLNASSPSIQFGHLPHIKKKMTAPSTMRAYN